MRIFLSRHLLLRQINKRERVIFILTPSAGAKLDFKPLPRRIQFHTRWDKFAAKRVTFYLLRCRSGWRRRWRRRRLGRVTSLERASPEARVGGTPPPPPATAPAHALCGRCTLPPPPRLLRSPPTRCLDPPVFAAPREFYFWAHSLA